MEPAIKGAFIITGATGSIGKELAYSLAQTKMPIILACRNLESGEELRHKIIDLTGNKKIYARQLFLESPASIKAFVENVTADGLTINGLINNAGTIERKYSKTKEGLETTFAVNYIGTIMLTLMLMPNMIKGGHITFTTSITRKLHQAGTISINEKPEEFSQLGTYGRSKAALTHFAQYLSKCYPDVYINCADPGVVNSKMIKMDRWYDTIADVLFRPLTRTPQSGAKSTLQALLLKETGNIVTNHSVHRIKYDTYDKAHGHLIEETKDMLTNLGLYDK